MSTPVTHHIYSWPAPCPHSVVVDARGNYVHPDELKRPGTRGVQSQASVPCQACQRPNDSHPYFMTRASASGMGMNPHAAAFTPPPPPSLPTTTPAPAYAAATPAARHKKGLPCPENHSNCHWHHGDTKPCHTHWQHCTLAKAAVRASYYNNRSKWIGAPPGWNEEHERCNLGDDDPKLARIDRGPGRRRLNISLLSKPGFIPKIYDALQKESIQEYMEWKEDIMVEHFEQTSSVRTISKKRDKLRRKVVRLRKRRQTDQDEDESETRLAEAEAELMTFKDWSARHYAANSLAKQQLTGEKPITHSIHALHSRASLARLNNAPASLPASGSLSCPPLS
ncbi:hypothetical protein MBLNU459_g2455t1 [Dothideomycetes sp. NU459]